MGNDGSWFQGEINKNKKPDGLGVLIKPDKTMVIGHCKNGKSHGISISYKKNGEKVVGEHLDDQR
jgi:antitoxin component YwqK of YwqJK toxin-antitoxin module